MSYNIYAQIIVLEPKTPIKAEDINHNFNEAKQILIQRNGTVQFNIFQSGDLISKEIFETEFNKARALGISINNLNSDYIIADELNNAFSQLITGASLFDDIPVSSNVLLNTNEDQSQLINFNFINVIGTNTIEIVSSPQNGSLVPSLNSFNYIPNANFNGNDSFIYRIFDGTNYSNSSSVNINVAPVNDNPIANTQNLITNEDTSLNISLSGFDIENSSLTYSLVSFPSNGTLSGTLPNLTYTPNANYTGSDSFTFKVNDGQLDSVVSTIYISVLPINDAPLISGSSTLNVIQNSFQSGQVSGSDVENSSLTYSLLAQPTKGSVSFGINGAYTYTASTNAFGADSFSIRVFDGELYSEPFIINVTISGSGLILNSGVRTYFDGTLAESCNQYLTQNSGNYTYTGQTGSGKYRIKPQSSVATTYDVDCDMVSEGGGWTKINAQTASAITGSFNANQQMIVSNLPSGNCTPGPFSMRINNIKIPYTRIRMDMTRGATIVQCATLSKYATATSITTQNGYVDNINLVSSSMCTWNDNIWARAQGNVSSSGLRLNWRILANKDPDSTGVSFYSTCSYTTDNGSITATWFVK